MCLQQEYELYVLQQQSVKKKRSIKGIWLCLSKEKLALAIQDLNLIVMNITVKTAELNSVMGEYKRDVRHSRVSLENPMERYNEDRESFYEDQ